MSKRRSVRKKKCQNEEEVPKKIMPNILNCRAFIPQVPRTFFTTFGCLTVRRHGGSLLPDCPAGTEDTFDFKRFKRKGTFGGGAGGVVVAGGLGGRGGGFQLIERHQSQTTGVAAGAGQFWKTTGGTGWETNRGANFVAVGFGGGAAILTFGVRLVLLAIQGVGGGQLFRRVDAGGIQFCDGNGAKIVLPLPKIHRLQHFRRRQGVHHCFVVAKDVQHGPFAAKRTKFKTFALGFGPAGAVFKKLKFRRITPFFPLVVGNRHVFRFHLFHFVAVDDDVHDALV